jgi:hypothetical protein
MKMYQVQVNEEKGARGRKGLREWTEVEKRK